MILRFRDCERLSFYKEERREREREKLINKMKPYIRLHYDVEIENLIL